MWTGIIWLRTGYRWTLLGCIQCESFQANLILVHIGRKQPLISTELKSTFFYSSPYRLIVQKFARDVENRQYEGIKLIFEIFLDVMTTERNTKKKDKQEKYDINKETTKT